MHSAKCVEKLRQERCNFYASRSHFWSYSDFSQMNWIINKSSRQTIIQHLAESVVVIERKSRRFRTRGRYNLQLIKLHAPNTLTDNPYLYRTRDKILSRRVVNHKKKAHGITAG